jgi:hypothetical protein
MAELTPQHDAVLALLDWLPEDAEVDAALVAGLLSIPEVEALRLLGELEAEGCLASAVSPLQ